MISTVYRRTPPDGYGGVERVVHTLVEELVRLGHQVTLFATPGSRSAGTTVEVSGYDPDRAPSGIASGRDILSEEPLYHAVRNYLQRVPVDVIHDWSYQNLYVLRHPRSAAFLISTCIPPPPGYSRPNLVAASAAHRDLLGGRARFVRYGLRLHDWPHSYEKADHAVHIAKIARYKAQHEAILACRRAGRELWLVGNVEDRPYYYGVVRPLQLLSRRVRYLGETQGTGPLLRDAACLIQTPRWFEVFPLVVLEALASATPVVAYRTGGLPEQVEHGVTGFLCSTSRELAEALARISEIRPEACRRAAEDRFSVSRMALEYLDLYRRVMDGETW